MNIDAWIQMEKGALQVLWDLSHPDPDGEGNFPPIPAQAKFMQRGVRGFWKDITVGPDTFEVVNVLKSVDDIATFEAANASDIRWIYSWVQGNGLDNLDDYPTIPQDILDVMLDHPIYDVDGNQIGSTPATFANPNWGHNFLGQKTRIFAGEFSTEFSQEFF